MSCPGSGQCSRPALPPRRTHSAGRDSPRPCSLTLGSDPASVTGSRAWSLCLGKEGDNRDLFALGLMDTMRTPAQGLAFGHSKHGLSSWLAQPCSAPAQWAPVGASRLEDTQPRAELSGAHLSPAPSQRPAAGSCGPGALSCCLRASWTRGQTSPWAAYSSLYSPGQRLAQGTPGGLVHRPLTSLGGPLRSDSARLRSGARRPGPWERGSGVWMRETEPRFPAVPICPQRPVGPGPGPCCGCGQGQLCSGTPPA